ncbi:MAG: DUF5655 domain-containing protein [Bacteroidota bacterium]
MCIQKDVGELFVGKPDELVLAYDDIIQVISQWEPHSLGASINTIVITSQKAWLIIKPMKKELDLKFYHDEALGSKKLKKVQAWGKKFAHHIRIKGPEELDEEVLELLRMGFEYSLR